MRLRIALAAAGIALGLFGVFRLLTQVPVPDLIQLLVWLVAALVLHDGILSPLLLAVGAFLARIPPRARTALQGGLLVGGLVTVIALPLIDRAYSQPASKAILEQNFTANLGILLAVVAAAAVVLYVVLLLRSRPGSPRPRPRPRPQPGPG